jgi:threonine aldolase
MRQSGILAAAGLYALDHNLARLGEDHENARRLARGLSGFDGVEVPHEVETNIVFARFEGRSAEALCIQLMGQGVLVHPDGSDTLRFVTHLDARAPAIDEALERVGRVLSAEAGPVGA